MKNKMKNTLINGVIVLLPISITVYVFYKAFQFIDGLTSKYNEHLIGNRIFGLGFITTILFIYIIGLIAKLPIGKKIINVIECIIIKIPVAKSIYQSVKELVSMLLNRNRAEFNQSVLVDFPMEGAKSIGFITKDNVKINNENRVIIFVPTTPNPTSGYMIMVKKEDIQYLDITIEEAMKMVISLGAVSIDSIPLKNIGK